MRRSYYGGSSRSPMDEYIERITKMQKTPSIIPDFPDFPNVHEALNNKSSNNNNNEEIHSKKMSYMNNQKCQAPEAQKEVHFVESEDKGIDVEANGYILQKHKSFALCKWYTYREY